MLEREKDGGKEREKGPSTGYHTMTPSPPASQDPGHLCPACFQAEPEMWTHGGHVASSTAVHTLWLSYCTGLGSLPWPVAKSDSMTTVLDSITISAVSKFSTVHPHQKKNTETKKTEYTFNTLAYLYTSYIIITTSLCTEH